MAPRWVVSLARRVLVHQAQVRDRHITGVDMDTSSDGSHAPQRMVVDDALVRRALARILRAVGMQAEASRPPVRSWGVPSQTGRPASCWMCGYRRRTAWCRRMSCGTQTGACPSSQDPAPTCGTSCRAQAYQPRSPGMGPKASTANPKSYGGCFFSRCFIWFIQIPLAHASAPVSAWSTSYTPPASVPGDLN